MSTDIRSSCRTRVALFVGISVTYESFVVGIHCHRYWTSAMAQLQGINRLLGLRQRSSLPAELLNMIRFYLEIEGEKAGREKYLQRLTFVTDKWPNLDCQCGKSLEQVGSPLDEIDCPRHHELAKLECAFQDEEYLNDNFGLTIHFGFDLRTRRPHSRPEEDYVYIYIPYSVDGRSLGFFMGASQVTEITAAMAPRGPFERRDGALRISATPVECLIDQDLNITEEKRSRINKAISELSLTVCDSKGIIYRQSDLDSSSCLQDYRFKSTVDTKQGRVWEPRVIMSLWSLLQQRLPEAPSSASAI